MPKIARELSAIEVKRLASKPGFHPVGGVPGLALNVTATGAASWILRAMCAGRRRDYGLGGFPGVKLAQARQTARDYRAMIRKGVDPADERQAAVDALRAAKGKRRTFRQATEAFLKRKTPEFKNGKHALQWRATLETYAYPVIGNLPVDAIEIGHINRILDPIWSTKTETAKRLRARIESVLAYAAAKGYRSGDNPARWRGNLDAVMPKPGKLTKVRHHAALPVDELPGFMSELRQRDGMGARALEFAVLTAARSGEVRGATWAEIDLRAKVWTVPGERMKAGEPHRVPLTPAALAILEAVPRLEGSNYVFPAARGGMLSDMTLSAVTRRMKVDAVPHGIARSTFRDWCSERTNYPREVAEKALAHAIENKTEAAYRRGDLLGKRRRLMAEWAKFCETVPKDAATVTPIRKGATA